MGGYKFSKRRYRLRYIRRYGKRAWGKAYRVIKKKGWKARKIVTRRSWRKARKIVEVLQSHQEVRLEKSMENLQNSCLEKEERYQVQKGLQILQEKIQTQIYQKIW